MPDAALEILTREGEAAIAEQADDLLVRVRQFRRHGEGRADAEIAERARIHPPAGRLRLDDTPGEGEHVAGIADEDRVLSIRDRGTMASPPDFGRRMSGHNVGRCSALNGARSCG